MKHIALAFLFTTLSLSLINGMEEPKQTTNSDLHFFQHLQLPIGDETIPREIKQKVFDVLIFRSPKLSNAVEHLHSLDRTSKSIHVVINQHENMRSLIKQLSIAYDTSNEEASKQLQFKISNDIFLSQVSFAVTALHLFPKGDSSFLLSDHIIHSNLDLNFTHGIHSDTLLMGLIDESCKARSSGGFKLIEFFIKNSRDIHIANRCGKTALSELFKGFIEKKFSISQIEPLFECMWQHHSFDANKFYDSNLKLINANSPQSCQTTILHLFTSIAIISKSKQMPHSRNEECMDIRKYFLKAIKRLVEKDFNFELKGIVPINYEKQKSTLLEIAQQYNDEELIGILKNAIAKKTVKNIV